MADHLDTGRVIRSEKVELPDMAERVDWAPVVLTGKTPTAFLPMQFREAARAKSRPTDVQQREQAPAKPRLEKAPLTQPPIRKDESLEQIAGRRPQDVARIIQMILHAEDGNPDDIGVLMIGLGTAVAGSVLQHCTAEDVSTIAKVVAEYQTVTVQEKEAVFESVRKRLFEGEYVLQGGTDFARKMLQKALGNRRAEMMMGRLDVDHGGFQLLRGVEPEQLVPFLTKEHPQTIALVLTQMDTDQAADVLNRLHTDLQGEVMHRVAQMNTVSPQVMRELEDRLSDELQALLSGQITKLGGPIAAAKILNQTRQTTEKHVMGSLDTVDPDLAEKVRNQMFVFDDIATLTDNEIQLLLKKVDRKDLAIGLKGGCEELQARIFQNVSDEIAKDIKEKMQFSGPVRMSDVEEVQLRIVKVVRELDEKGEVMMMRRGSDVFI